jgi:hypothetical protein
MAEIYEKTVDDMTVILGVREPLVQPFLAPNWLDLRVGFFLSLTQAVADDTTSGLAETIAGSLDSPGRYFIGVKTDNDLLPRTAGTVFMGFTNASRLLTQGDSRLSSSDIDLGTTNTNFWRPNNSRLPYWSFLTYDGLTIRASGGTSGAALAQHFPQNPVAVGGYAVLLGLRLTRPNVASRTITVHVKSSGHSADMIYSSVPDKELLRDALLQTWPASQVFGPVELSGMPTALFCYWPFFSSRLRIHAAGVLKVK